jgi:hypothetical protein
MKMSVVVSGFLSMFLLQTPQPFAATPCVERGCYCDRQNIPPSCFSESQRCCPGTAPKSPDETIVDDLQANVTNNQMLDYLDCYSSTLASPTQLLNREPIDTGLYFRSDAPNSAGAAVFDGAFPPPAGAKRRLYVMTRKGMHAFSYDELYEARMKRAGGRYDESCKDRETCNHVLVIPSEIMGEKSSLCVSLRKVFSHTKNNVEVSQVPCSGSRTSTSGVTVPDGSYLTAASKKLVIDQIKERFPKVIKPTKDTPSFAMEPHSSIERVTKAVNSCQNVPELKLVIAQRRSTMPRSVGGGAAHSQSGSAAAK